MSITTALLLSLFLSFSFQTNAILHDVYWRDYTHGDIPYDAIEIESNGRYIGLIHAEKGLIPAMIYPSLHLAVYELFGKKATDKRIKILCTPNKNRIYWEYVDFSKPIDNQMKNAILGGYYDDGASLVFNVFIGKLYHEKEWKVGKVVPIEHPAKALIVWDGKGQSVHVQQFYMLKYNTTIILPNGCVLNG